MKQLSDDDIGRALEAARQTPPAPEVGEAIVEAVTSDLRPARGASPTARGVYSLLVVIAVAAAFFAWFAQSGPSGSARGLLAWGILAGVLVTVGVGSRPGRGLTLGFRRALVVAVPVLFLVALLAGSDGVLPFGQVFADPASRHALTHCAVVSAVMGFAIGGAVLGLWSRTDPFVPGLTGALAGLGGGLVGAVATNAVCPVHEAWHLGLGHASVVLALGAVGWAVGRRALRP